MISTTLNFVYVLHTPFDSCTTPTGEKKNVKMKTKNNKVANVQ